MYSGVLRVNDSIYVKNDMGKCVQGRVAKLFSFRGMERVEATQVEAGDIVMIAGLPTVEIGDTLSVSPDQENLPAIAIDEPTISLNFIVNDSPFAGREGKFVTNKQIRERLRKNSRSMSDCGSISVMGRTRYMVVGSYMSPSCLRTCAVRASRCRFLSRRSLLRILTE